MSEQINAYRDGGNLFGPDRHEEQNDPKRERVRRINGAILTLLSHGRPYPLDLEVIHNVLNDLNFSISEDELWSRCAFLKERKLINIESRYFGGVQIEEAQLTSDGLRVLDGFAKDVCVDVRF